MEEEEEEKKNIKRCEKLNPELPWQEQQSSKRRFFSQGYCT